MRGGGGRGTNPASTEYYKIGQYAKGGVIIWLTDDGQHGLVAAISDATGSAAWDTGDYASQDTGADYNFPLPKTYGNTTPALNYAGGKNQSVLSNLGLTHFPAAQAAASYAGGGYHDWFLPSIAELSVMYAMIDTINAAAALHGGTQIITNANPLPDPGAFSKLLYWSSLDGSREFSGVINAWLLHFADGCQGFAEKDRAYAVRCVRAF